MFTYASHVIVESFKVRTRYFMIGAARTYDIHRVLRQQSSRLSKPFASYHRARGDRRVDGAGLAFSWCTFYMSCPAQLACIFSSHTVRTLPLSPFFVCHAEHEKCMEACVCVQLLRFASDLSSVRFYSFFHSTLKTDGGDTPTRLHIHLLPPASKIQKLHV